MKKIIVSLSLLTLAACGGQDSLNKQQDPQARHRAELHTNLATAYYSKGQMGTALDEFKQAAAIDGTYAPAHIGLGMVYAALKQDAQAEVGFKRALQLDPGNSEAHNNYGAFLCSRNRIDESIREFLTAVSNPLYASSASAYTNAGICAMKKQDVANAETYFRKALQADPGARIAAYHMAVISFNRGEHVQARTYLNIAMQSIEPNAEMLWLGVRNARKLDDRDAEASYSLLLKRKYPNSAETKALMAE
ncbi:MAG: type IV pilus biogenesis/stability protein PilW [Methylobacillus sp.]|jgi:type IV pilus assembly protein PilF|nr:type IV pilus biogenesis/stability protein PilW [Methylobacillus sp.]